MDFNNSFELVENNIVDIENIENNVNIDNTEKETVIKSTKKVKKNIVTCPVIGVINKNRYIINFNNYGIIVTDDVEAQAMNGKKVKIEYSGKIGKDDFVFEVIEKNV